MKPTTQERIAKLKLKLQQLKAKCNQPFEFKYDNSKLYIIGISCYVASSYTSYEDHLTNGRYRKSKKVAEDALALQKRVMILHALVEQLNGFKGNYFIYKSNNVWIHEYVSPNIYYPETVLMTEDCAVTICELLNSGKVTL